MAFIDDAKRIVEDVSKKVVEGSGKAYETAKMKYSKFDIQNDIRRLYEELGKAVAKFNTELDSKGRIMIRASGTEPKVRVMVESKDKAENERIAEYMVSLIKHIDNEV